MFISSYAPHLHAQLVLGVSTVRVWDLRVDGTSSGMVDNPGLFPKAGDIRISQTSNSADLVAGKVTTRPVVLVLSFPLRK